MNDAQQRELIGRYLAAYNAFDVDGMLALLSPAVCFENHAGSELTASTHGLAEFRRLAQKSAALFSEREQRITALQFHDGVATADIAYRGRLATHAPGGPPAGTVLELQGRSEFWFRHGRIARIVDRS